MGETVIVVGLGSRRGVSEAEVLAAIDAALAAHGLARGDIGKIATIGIKRDEPGLRAAARAIGFKLAIVDDAALAGFADRTQTRSDLSLEKAGTPSVSEAAALAAAGHGAKLLGPRIVVGPVTCAVADGENAPSTAFGGPPPPLRGVGYSGAAGRDTDPPPFAGEGDHAKRGGGGDPDAPPREPTP